MSFHKFLRTTRYRGRGCSTDNRVHVLCAAVGESCQDRSMGELPPPPEQSMSRDRDATQAAAIGAIRRHRRKSPSGRKLGRTTVLGFTQWPVQVVVIGGSMTLGVGCNTGDAAGLPRRSCAYASRWVDWMRATYYGCLQKGRLEVSNRAAGRRHQCGGF